nr:hypothetical protein [Stackebrandtia nassauensis]
MVDAFLGQLEHVAGCGHFARCTAAGKHPGGFQAFDRRVQGAVGDGFDVTGQRGDTAFEVVAVQRVVAQETQDRQLQHAPIMVQGCDRWVVRLP